MRVAAPLLGLALLATSCGGKSDDEGSSADDPVRGGSLSYGIEAETPDGWCLPEAQLAISGITVARSIYDPLVVPNEDGGYDPYLLSAIEPNEDYTQWTLQVREGITFHDGTPLTAEVVKNNLDAYRGYVGKRSTDEATPHPTRSPLLFVFTFDDIDDVQVTGENQVTVTTQVPWVSLPAHLWASGRVGMLAQAQLDDTETCDTKPIGTGPFRLERWSLNDELVVVRNQEYWQEAPDGEPYPYLDEIRFVPVVEGEQRVNSLEAGEIDIAHLSQYSSMETTDGLAEDGVIETYDSDALAELTHLMINTSKPPFDDIRVRRAVAMAIDRDDYLEVITRGRGQLASGPFAEGSIAHLEDAGYPDFDPEGAKALLAEYEADKGDIGTVSLPSTPDASSQELAIYVQQALEDVGIATQLTTVQQDTEIDAAIAGDFQLNTWRNYPGGDPDELFVWFDSASPANFGRIDDPEIDRLFAEGRGEPDQGKRAEIYQDVNRQLTEGMWIIPLTWVNWRLAAQPTVHGYTPGSQPVTTEDNQWAPGLAVGHPLHGLWVAS
jgi:peptide/nickel transport system substrate-binding protein